jgi:hypothetical protein
MKPETAQATKIRPLKELLQIMLDNIHRMKNGLCELAAVLPILGIISEDEELEIQKMIQSHPEYHPFQYTWPVSQTKPRIDWLKEKLTCEHPEIRKEYYREGCYKCWECGKIIIEEKLTKQKEDEEEGITQRE